MRTSPTVCPASSSSSRPARPRAPPSWPARRAWSASPRRRTAAASPSSATTAARTPTTVSARAHLEVTEGQEVTAGDALVEGPKDPKELLDIKGIRETQQYLVEEVQKVYRDQGVSIHDKHIELIVRQMLRRVSVAEPGDATFLPGERVDSRIYAETNRALVQEGKRPAEGRPELMGITKASLATESWLSAASFQETTRVLTEAAIEGKSDQLFGLKENIIIGKLIPAGTGMTRYRDVDMDAPDAEPLAVLELGQRGGRPGRLAGQHRHQRRRRGRGRGGRGLRTGVSHTSALRTRHGWSAYARTNRGEFAFRGRQPGMKLYAEVTGVRVRQILFDVALVLWVYVWVRIGMRVHDLVEALAAPGRAPGGRGRQLRGLGEQAGRPGRRPADRGRPAGRRLRQRGPGRPGPRAGGRGPAGRGAHPGPVARACCWRSSRSSGPWSATCRDGCAGSERRRLRPGCGPRPPTCGSSPCGPSSPCP